MIAPAESDTRHQFVPVNSYGFGWPHGQIQGQITGRKVFPDAWTATLGKQRRIVEYLDGLRPTADNLKTLQEQTAQQVDAFTPFIRSKTLSGGL